MRRKIQSLLFLSTFIAMSLAQECRFAKSYSLNDVRNPTIRKAYLENVVKQEAKFIKDLGVNKDTGLTQFGYQLSLTSGELYKPM